MSSGLLGGPVKPEPIACLISHHRVSCPPPHKIERLEAGSLAQPALIDFALDDVLLRLLCAQAQEYNSCSVCSVKIMAYYPLD